MGIWLFSATCTIRLGVHGHNHCSRVCVWLNVCNGKRSAAVTVQKRCAFHVSYCLRQLQQLL